MAHEWRLDGPSALCSPANAESAHPEAGKTYLV